MRESGERRGGVEKETGYLSVIHVHCTCSCILYLHCRTVLTASKYMYMYMCMHVYELTDYCSYHTLHMYMRVPTCTLYILNFQAMNTHKIMVEILGM